MSPSPGLSGLLRRALRALRGDAAGSPRLTSLQDGALALDLGKVPSMTFVGEAGETRLDFRRATGRLWTLRRWAETELGAVRRVGLLLPLGHDLILAWAALIAAGKEPVILQYFNDRQQRVAWAASIENTYAAAGLEAVIHSREIAGLGLADHLNLVFLPDGEAEDDAPFLIPLTASFLQLSSGTTGHRKAIRFTLADVVRHLDDYAKVMAYGPRDVIVSWLPLYHDMGFVACFLAALVRRVPLVLMDPIYWVREPAVLNRAIARHGGTIVYLPNFGFEVMARAPGESTLKSVRCWVSCSEPTYQETIAKFMARYGVAAHRIRVCYAMAENIFAVTQSDGFEVLHDEAGPPLVSCGRPIPGVEVKIVDGEVYVKSPVSLDRYIDGPSIRDAEGFYPTGDLGRLIDGALVIAGRKGDLVNIAGRKYYLNDLDNLVNQLDPAVKGRAAALALRHEALGTEQAVVLIEDPLFYRKDPSALIEAVREASGIESLDIHYVPPKFLTKTSSGKINRRKTAADWRAAVDWRRAHAAVARPPLAAELARAFPRSRRDAPVGETLDSLGITVLQAMLAERALAYDPALSLDDYHGLAEPPVRTESAESAVSIVSVGEAAFFATLTEAHLAALGERLGQRATFEHVTAPPSGVLLSDLIFHDYFLPRLSPEEAAPYEAFRRIVRRIKAAAMLILDDVSELELAHQHYMMLSHDFVRRPEADLMVTRPYRYVQEHHRLPVQVVQPKSQLPPVAETQVELSAYLQTPIYRMAIFQGRPWAGALEDWEYLNPVLPHPLPPAPWPVDLDAVMEDIAARLTAFYGQEIRRTPTDPATPSIRLDGSHMCSDRVLPEKLEPVLERYQRVLIIGPEHSAPYIRRRLTELGKTWIQSTAHDFTTVGISEDEFDCAIQAGSWGRPKTDKPVFQLITAGWADDAYRARQPTDHWFRQP